MVARAALVASLLACALVALASRAEASLSLDPRGSAQRAVTSGAAELCPCRVVKVVYAGHGEGERGVCRPVERRRTAVTGR